MTEWWTYTLSDFLLFSPRTYYRLLELYNLALWPLQVVGVIVGLITVALWLRNRARLASLLLALSWLWVAWAFHAQRYAQINWAAPWFAAAFAVEAVALLTLGTIAGRLDFRVERDTRMWLAIGIAAIMVAGYPLVAPLAGRGWTTAETFGLTADPTALATAALVSQVRGHVRWLLLALPLAWCAIAAATLWAMESPAAVLPALLGLAGAALAVRRGRSDALRSAS